MLSLSPACQPQLRLGTEILVPANMTDGSDRIAALEGLLEWLRLLAEAPEGRARLPEAFLTAPFARDFVRPGGDAERPAFSLVEGFEDKVSFRADRLSITFLDGRARSFAESFRADTGDATASYLAIVSRLASGLKPKHLDRLPPKRRRTVDQILEILGRRGLILDGPPPGPAGELVPDGDAIAWYGHASLAFSTRKTRVWIDPLMPPALDLRGDGALFSPAFAESRWIDAYGPSARFYARAELPPPDVVCITHQDRDHLDLGLLATLPKKTPILVPEPTGAPWDVDLSALIAKVLGRPATVLRHGEARRFRDVEIAAFPFQGEMPSALAHRWNCYLIEGPRGALAATADSRLDGATVDALRRLRRRRRTPLVLAAGPIRDREAMPGWREGLSTTRLWSSDRLWGWYVPVAGMFTAEQCTNVTVETLTRLRDRAGLVSYLPYAVGSVPWFRIFDPTDAFAAPVTSLSVADVDRLGAALPEGVALFPLRYARPGAIG